MQIKTTGIILSNTKYGDKKVISKIYTRDLGLQTYIVNYGSSPKSKIRSAHLQPLNIVDLEIFAKEKNEVNRISEIRIHYPYREVNFHVIKNCIAAFVNEALIKTLRESEPNEILFDFISSSLKELDQLQENYAAWHLYFLMELTKHLGFFPLDNHDENNIYFNLMDGRFEPVPPAHAHYLDRGDSIQFSRLIKYHQNYLDNPPPASDRNTQLNLVIQYYRFHIPGFTDFRTLPVLQATLHG